MSSQASVQEQTREAMKALPALLRTSDPAALAGNILPILNKPWPESCEKALSAGGSSSGASSQMRSPYLPLLQQEQFVTCLNCKRVLIVDCFEEHKVPQPQDTASYTTVRVAPGGPSA